MSELNSKTIPIYFGFELGWIRDGQVVSACCGRRIEIGWGEVFDCEYHFNPDPTSRSLEWNGVNLLKK